MAVCVSTLTLGVWGTVLVADIRRLEAFGNDTFDIVIDKGRPSHHLISHHTLEPV